MDNVVPFALERKKKSQKKEKPTRATAPITDWKHEDKLIELSEGLYPMGKGTPSPNGGWRFCSRDSKTGLNIKILRYPSGESLVVTVTPDGIVAKISDQDLLRMITSYCEEVMEEWPPEARFVIEEKDSKTIRYLWDSRALHMTAVLNPLIDDPFILQDEDVKPFLFKSDSGFCWHRMPFDPSDEGKELWEKEVFPRIATNLTGLLAWCGSLLDMKSDREMSPWIHGAGGSGKSSFADVIRIPLGAAAATSQDKYILSGFGLEPLRGVRMCVIAEAKKDLICNSTWKTITGDNHIMVNRKGIKMVSMDFHCKFMIISNDFPSIRAGDEYRRRVFDVEIVKPDAWKQSMSKADFVEKLSKNAAYFWKRALEEYAKDPYLKNVDQSRIIEAQESHDEDCRRFCEKYLVIPSAKNFVPVNDIKTVANSMNIPFKALDNYLTETLGIKKESRKRSVGGPSAWCYLDIRDRMGNFVDICVEWRKSQKET